MSNSGSLPLAPDAIVEGYREALAWDSGRWGSEGHGRDFDGLVGDWEAQVDLTSIVGLLLRGWRKGLDAEAGMTLAVRRVARPTTWPGGASERSRPPSVDLAKAATPTQLGAARSRRGNTTSA